MLLRAILAIGIFLLAGCHSPVVNMQNETMSAQGKALVDAAKQNNELARKNAMRMSQLPRTVEASLAPLPNHDVLEAQVPTFDVAVNDMPINDFFLYMANMTGINIIVSPDVTHQAITLSLNHVTLESILGAVKDKYAISYTHTPYGYYITPRGMITHFFHVNYLNTASQSFTTVDVNNASLSASSSGGVGASPNGVAAQNNDVISKNSTRYDNANFWKEVRMTIESFLSKKEKRNVTINQNDAIVIVTAYPEQMTKISAYIGELNEGLNKEILIEAKFLEVTLNAQYKTGINWSQLGLQVSTDTGSIHVSQPFSFTDINSVINLLSQQGQITVLSNPRVTALNNQPALIKVGSDSYYVTGVNSGTTPIGQTATLTSNVQLAPFFSGISLSVIPHILLNKKIQLHVHPVIDMVSEENKVINLGQNQTMVLPLATTTSRETDTAVQVEDTQVIVLGGLMQSVSQVDKKTFAVLQSTGFYPEHADDGSTTELVILLKVSIVNNNNGIWNENFQEARDTFASFTEFQKNSIK